MAYLAKNLSNLAGQLVKTDKLAQDQIKPIALPSWILWLQCISFAILFGVWVMPETILIRHAFLILGALVGLYVIVRNHHLR